jgi:hypothetical protein
VVGHFSLTWTPGDDEHTSAPIQTHNRGSLERELNFLTVDLFIGNLRVEESRVRQTCLLVRAFAYAQACDNVAAGTIDWRFTPKWRPNPCRARERPRFCMQLCLGWEKPCQCDLKMEERKENPSSKNVGFHIRCSSFWVAMQVHTYPSRTTPCPRCE